MSLISSGVGSIESGEVTDACATRGPGGMAFFAEDFKFSSILARMSTYQFAGCLNVLLKIHMNRLITYLILPSVVAISRGYRLSGVV